MQLKKIYQEILAEKQRFAKEKGQKITPSSQIKHLYDSLSEEEREWTFIHYSRLNKLGLNPQNKFNTPTGIYAYPLSKWSSDALAKGKVPFGGDRNFMHFFKIKPQYRNKIVRLQDGEMISPGMSEQQINKLILKYKNNPSYSQIVKDAEKESRVQSSFGKYWNITRNICLKERTWHHQIDDPSEPNPFNIQDPEEPPPPYDVDGGPDYEDKTDTNKWAKMLVSDGIYGVIDIGSSIIHPSEPTQAVFFSKEYIEQIKTVEKNNKSDNTSQEQIDLNIIYKAFSKKIKEFNKDIDVGRIEIVYPKYDKYSSSMTQDYNKVYYQIRLDIPLMTIVDAKKIRTFVDYSLGSVSANLSVLDSSIPPNISKDSYIHYDHEIEKYFKKGLPIFLNVKCYFSSSSKKETDKVINQIKQIKFDKIRKAIKDNLDYFANKI